MKLSLTALFTPLPPPQKLSVVLGIEPRAPSKHLPLSYPPGPRGVSLLVTLWKSLIAAYDQPSISGNVRPLPAAFSVGPI